MNNPGSGSKGHFAVFLFLALIAVHDFLWTAMLKTYNVAI